MKTAISIPDEVFAAAEELAERLGMSRSELYANAVAEFLERERSQGVTARLNEVYDASPADVDPALAAAQVREIPPEDW